MRLALSLLLWVILCAPQMSLATDRQADQQAGREGLAKVDSLLQVGAAEAAVLTCRDLLKSLAAEPVYGWQIEGRLGVALLLANEPGAAVPYLEAMVRRQPREAAHHRNLGAALVLLNRRGRALSEYRVAVELAPGEAALRREYGQMLLSFGDTKNAANQLQVAWRLCGGCQEMDDPLINLYLAQKNFGAAVVILARQYEQDDSSVTRRRLVTAMSQAANDSALVIFLRTTPALDRTGDEWRLLIEAEGRWSGDLQATQRVVSRLQSDQPSALPAAISTDHRFWGHVALNLLAEGDYMAGLLAIDQALALSPDELVYLNNRVVLLTKLGRDDEARVAWQRVLAIDPSRAPQELNATPDGKEN